MEYTIFKTASGLWFVGFWRGEKFVHHSTFKTKEEAEAKAVQLNQETAVDAKAGEQLKEEGMNLAADNRRELLALARKLAVEIAEANGGTAHADEVQAALIEHGYTPSDLGNAAGSIFKGGRWEFTGDFTLSERVRSHRNLLRIWRLK